VEWVIVEDSLDQVLCIQDQALDLQVGSEEVSEEVLVSAEALASGEVEAGGAQDTACPGDILILR
jgi:hypothetical protein